jgi:hypothetical protein
MDFPFTDWNFLFCRLWFSKSYRKPNLARLNYLKTQSCLHSFRCYLESIFNLSTLIVSNILTFQYLPRQACCMNEKHNGTWCSRWARHALMQLDFLYFYFYIPCMVSWVNPATQPIELWRTTLDCVQSKSRLERYYRRHHLSNGYDLLI